jgi:CBS domain-containing protein
MNRVRELIRTEGHAVHSVGKDTTLVEAARLFLKEEVSSLLVYDGPELAGIFTKNDLSRRCVERSGDLRNVTVEEGLTKDLFTTTPDADLNEVFAEMVQRGFRHVPVMEDGRGVGMLTPIDILVYQKDAAYFENEALVKYIQGSY